MRRLCFCALLCAVCLLCLIIPVANAETVTTDGVVYELRDGHACLAGFAKGAQTVTLHPYVNGYPTEYYAAADQLSGEEYIKEIAFAQGITTLNSADASYIGLLYRLTAVERILLPSTLRELNASAFFGLTSLKGFEVEKGNPAYCAIDGALYSSDGKELWLFPADVSGAYTLPSGVARIRESAFSISLGLTQLTIPEGVTELADYSLTGATGLAELMLPASLAKIGADALPLSGALQNITVAEGNQKYRSVGGVLFSKDRTTLLAFPSGKGGHYDIPPGTTAIAAGAFGYRSLLTGLTIPEGITELVDYTLSGMEELEQIHLPASLAIIGNQALPGYGSLVQITVAENSAHFQSYEGVLFSRDGKTLLKYPVGRAGPYEIPPGTLYIEQNAFWGNDDLTNVSVPDGVTALPNYLFSGIASLEEIHLPASLGEIGEDALPSYGALRHIEVAQGNPRYQSIDGVLFDGDELIFYPPMHGLSYDVPPGTKRISHRAFAECGLLQTISIPRGITEIGDEMFYNCTALERVSLPITLTKIGMGAFGNCIALTSITLPPGLELLGDFAFNNCSSLTQIHIPDNVLGLDKYVFWSHSPDFVLYAAIGTAGYWHAWEYDIHWAEPGGTPGMVKPTKRQTQAAVVNNASSQEQLSLFSKPSKGAKSLGKYANGTTMQVLDTKGDWTHVRLYGEQGYMPLESLMFTDTFNTLARITWGRKRKEIKEPLRLYAEPSQDAPSENVKEDVSMRILDTVGVWYHVQLQGREGYVPVQNLNVARSGMQNSDCYVVANPNSQDRLHLRQEPSAKSNSLGRYFNGTQVEAIGEYIKDGWVHVRVDGKEGYMMIQYLLPVYWGGEQSLWPHG